jgi:hypothetical protein
VPEQVEGVRAFWTHFRVEAAIMVGTLQPSEDSPVYTVKLVILDKAAPKVFVSMPEIRADAPHRYDDGSLCLYDPRTYEGHEPEWTPADKVADTVLPWAAVWLHLYEIWCETGTWYGPEAPRDLPTQEPPSPDAR